MRVNSCYVPLESVQRLMSGRKLNQAILGFIWERTQKRSRPETKGKKFRRINEGWKVEKWNLNVRSRKEGDLLRSCLYSSITYYRFSAPLSVDGLPERPSAAQKKEKITNKKPIGLEPTGLSRATTAVVKMGRLQTWSKAGQWLRYRHKTSVKGSTMPIPLRIRPLLTHSVQW